MTFLLQELSRAPHFPRWEVVAPVIAYPAVLMLKQKQEDKGARKDPRTASASAPRTVVASPASPSTSCHSWCPKRQPKVFTSSAQGMVVDEAESCAKRARASDSQPVVTK
eukprot:5009613-Amphidinium_carterae.2